MKSLYKVNDIVWYVTSNMKAKKAKVVEIEQRTTQKGVSIRYILSDKEKRMHPDLWPNLKAVRDHFREHFNKLLANLYP